MIPTGWQLPEVLIPDWARPSEEFSLTGEETHVWRASLHLPPDELERCLSLLSADERRRAARFHQDQDRNRFIAARGTLRMLLGQYLHLGPERIVLSYNHYGKPLLAKSSIQFNLTRRQDLALYAFARAPVGIDVELEDSVLDFQQLLPQIASASEQILWKTIPTFLCRQAFLHLWTRKEAWLKTAGTGLSFPPPQITVLGESAEIGRNLVPGFEVFGEWITFLPGEGFLATMMTPMDRSVEWFHWR